MWKQHSVRGLSTWLFQEKLFEGGYVKQGCYFNPHESHSGNHFAWPANVHVVVVVNMLTQPSAFSLTSFEDLSHLFLTLDLDNVVSSGSR